MQLINFTPHPINFLTNGETIVFPSRGVARVAVKNSTAFVEQYEGKEITFIRGSYGAVKNLPAPEKNVFYIVSSMVRVACPKRSDLCSPANLVRDEKGNIVGCLSFEV